MTSFVSELSDLLLTMKHCGILEDFSLSICPGSETLPSPVNVTMATLVSTMTACNTVLKTWLERHQVEPRSQVFYREPAEAGTSQPTKLRPFTAKTDVNLGESADYQKIHRSNFEALNLKIDTEPECFGAVNLSIAPSPTCLEALNLSVATSPVGVNLNIATSPCFHTADVNVGTTTDLKTLLDVGTSTECWDQVNLDDGGTASYFEPVNLHATGFTHDGDIFNLPAREEDLNVGVLFDMYREENPSAQIVPVAAALDLSQATATCLPPSSPNSRLQLQERTNSEGSISDSCYSCNECKKGFRWRKSLKRHMAEHREGNYLCHLCGKMYAESWRLSRHETVHGVGGFTCRICGQRCSDNSKLRRHIATHTSRKFGCSVCKREFTRQDLLKRHFEISHAKRRQFPCLQCSKVFSVKCNLESHEDSVHGGEVVKCDLCGKECKNKATYRVHRKTHTVPTYTCQICGRQFHRPIQYRNHMKNKHPTKSDSIQEAGFLQDVNKIALCLNKIEIGNNNEKQ